MGEVVAAAAITGATQLIGSKIASGGQSRAGQLQYRAQQDALRFAREQAEEERLRYEEEQSRLDAAWAADQARRAPFRNASLDILGGYGFSIPEESRQVPDRPENWTDVESVSSPGALARPEGNDFSGFSGVGRRTPTSAQTIQAMMGGGGGVRPARRTY